MFDNPRFWLGAVSALGVALVVAKDTQRRAPGELTRVHQREPDLSSRSGCVECHGDGETRMADACLVCHTDVGAHIQGSLGLHGSLSPKLAQECALCHSDHHGADFPVINGRSFHIAGVEDPASFDHALVGFQMEGMHLDLACIDCHANAQDLVLPEGGRRFLGLSQACSTCHENPHGDRLAKNCADCHNQGSFADLEQFEHTERFPLEGSHGSASCTDCHEEDSSHSVDAVSTKGVELQWRTCVDCHDSPHRSPFIEAIAQFEELASGDSCAACHRIQHTEFGGDEAELTVEQHALTGFPLEEPHGGLDCADCHASEQLGPHFEDRYPGRAADACQECHADAHLGFFERRSRQLSLASTPGCAECHLPHTFSDIPLDAFDHEHWTAFGLRGAHRQSACRSCHPLSKQPDATGRTFGRASEHFGAIESCATCHADPHEGGFDAEQDPQVAALRPEVVEGRASCARCHDETSFRSSPFGFDHARWTGFALEGAHGGASCVSCHARTRPNDLGRTWAAAAGTNCADCHQDSHGGQFAKQGVTDCRACHEDTSDFKTLHFDHDADTQFPLDGTHSTLACAECHRPWRPNGLAGPEIVRYRPMGRECVDCHGSTRSRVRSRGRKR